jgi:uncharacterized protein (DUF1800 family)
MEKRKVDCSGTRLIQLVGACLIIFTASVLGMAQTIPEAPVLISKDDSTRAYAIDANRWRGKIGKPIEAIKPGRSVMMFLTNVKDLLPDEGANAFRSYAEDGSRREYIFRIESFEPVKGMDWVYALRVTLDPNIENVGDVLVRITWRGMTTNRVRLGVGHAGDGPPDDEGSIPTPMPWQRPSEGKGGGQTEAVTPINYPDLMRFMQQATYGPSPALEQRLRRIGIHVWLNEQFNMPLPTNAASPSCDPTTGICTILPNVYPNLPLQNGNSSTGCPSGTPIVDCFRNNYTQYPMQRWFYTNALYGQDQLRRRVAWALLQIVVVAAPDIQQPSWMLSYQKMLDRNAFGNYRTLLKEVTLHPTMGNYLDMMLSTRFNYNENFAREINQLFAVGLFEMNLDGTLKLDANNQPIPTYTQATIDNFTKVFTGWQLCNTPSSCPNVQPAGTPNYIDPMLLNQSLHDVTSKTLYNYPGAPFPTIAAGQNGNVEIDQALDNIYNHPNVAPFVTKNLIQHLVTSDPSPAYVQRIATVFNTYRTDPNQLRYVVYAILTDPEARGNVKNDPRYGMLREPVLLATNTLRQFGAKAFTSTGCDLTAAPVAGGIPGCSDGAVNDFSNVMGQNVYTSPTVFNFYPPDYIVPNTNPSVLGPEFAIYTTSTAFQRANFVNQFAMQTGYSNTTGTNTSRPFGTSIDMTELQNASTADTTGNQLMNLLNSKLMHGTMSASMRSTILTAVTAVPATSAANHLLRGRTALYLVLTSSQYQIQK